MAAVCLKDVALVIDHSGSIRDQQEPGQDNWGQVIRFIRAVVVRLKVRKWPNIASVRLFTFPWTLRGVGEYHLA